MSSSRRIVISLPSSLVEEVDGLATTERRNRSELFREAMEVYIEDKKKRDLRDQLKKGYLEMASLNSMLAEEGLLSEGG